MTLIIKNAHVVSPDVEIANGSILIDGDRIKAVSQGSAAPAADEVFDAAGRLVVPGFIDMHIHGGMGYETTTIDPKAMPAIAEAKMKEGVTSFCPTTLTLPNDMLSESLALIEAYRRKPAFTKVIGTHLEGPYVNRECLGAQNPAFVRVPDFNEVAQLSRISPVSVVTYAMDVEGCVPFTKALTEAGILPSCGHTNATYAQFMAGRPFGMKRLTHFCNQMTKLHHREIGLVGAGLIDDDVIVEMICDKIHLCPDMIRLAFKVKPVERIQLITDAMEATGLPDGDYQLGGLAVVVSNGAARLKSNNALAGSTLKFNTAFRNVAEVTGLPLKDVVKTTSWNQACSLGISDLGKVEQGFRADLTVLDSDFNVSAVFIDGVRKC